MPPDNAPPDSAGAPCDFLTPAEAAAHLTLTERCLESLRTRGGGPAFHKLGRSVRYARDDIAAWARAGKRRSTRDR